MENIVMREFSIAIPTRNRPDVLQVLLGSILSQSVVPKEVIIVDDSDNANTENLTERLRGEFECKAIQLIYTRGKGEGITQARNMGIDLSTGEIHCCMDDDVILRKDYIANILKVYESHPHALGVAGHMENLYLSGISNGINRGFSFFSTEQDRCRVFPTGTSYPVPLNCIIECEWLSGTNCSFKREVLKEFRWDENLRRYSLCDDMDISYRIQKKHPKSLLMNPEAKVIHTHSEVARIADEYRIQMEISYHAYFFFKNIKQTFANMARFVYGIFFGRLLISILSRNPRSIRFTLKAQVYLLRNLRKVRQGLFSI
jgi:glycosyltransferase involved in cell wall biosynthesis